MIFKWMTESILVVLKKKRERERERKKKNNHKERPPPSIHYCFLHITKQTKQIKLLSLQHTYKENIEYFS